MSVFCDAYVRAVVIPVDTVVESQDVVPRQHDVLSQPHVRARGPRGCRALYAGRHISLMHLHYAVGEAHGFWRIWKCETSVKSICE